jgi:hypothetical protein
MATQLTIVNNILRRLREDQTTSVSTSPYSKLIGQFVNDAKADLEDMNYEWSAYETEIDTTILGDSSTVTYDLTGTNDRSWLLRQSDDDRIPLAFDVTANSTAQLYDMPLKDLRSQVALAGGPLTDTQPTVFAVQSDSDGRGWTLRLLFSSDNARTWRSYWYVPQADLALDGTDDATELLLPARPIEMRALFYALNERGEEMGEPGGIASGRAEIAAAAAMENDMVVQKKSDEIQITNNEYI